MMTLNLAIGQATPPMAINLMVTARIAGVSTESTIRWLWWPIAAMLVALLLVVAPVLAACQKEAETDTVEVRPVRTVVADIPALRAGFDSWRAMMAGKGVTALRRVAPSVG